ncbi:MAG: MFS transporter [Deltaproteobacteria bacterium]|nr:MFS transporter [Deltaproteobacteria bacterium]
MGRRAVAVIIAGFSTVFVAFAIRYGYGLLLPEMLSSLSISKAEAGVIYSSYFFTATLFSPVLGLLVDRWDARAILTVFVAILGMGACLMSFSATVLQASLFFAIVGIGHSACWAPVVTVVLRWVSERRRGIALSVVDLGSTVSIAFWSIMIPVMIAPYGWRMVWVCVGVLGLLVAGMNFLFVRSHPSSEPESRLSKAAPKVQISIKEAYLDILRDKRFHLIGFSYLLISFSILIPLLFLTAYGAQELKISYSSAAALLAVIGVSGAVGKLVLGPISDFVGRVKVMMLCGVLIAAGGLGFAYAREFVVLLLFTVVFGIGYGTIWPVFAASARDLFSKEYAGSIVGLWTVYHGLGSIVAPVLAGWTIDVTGTYFWAFILTVTSAILSSLLLLPLAKRC